MLSDVWVQKSTHLVHSFTRYGARHIGSYFWATLYIIYCYVLFTYNKQVDLISLTVDTLNERLFVPHKDHQLDELVTGRLQLANGTQLIVDELQMQPGTLNDNGAFDYYYI